MESQLDKMKNEELCEAIDMIEDMGDLHIFISLLRYGDNESRKIVTQIINRTSNKNIDFEAISDKYNNNISVENHVPSDIMRQIYEFILEIQKNPQFAAIIYLVIRNITPEFENTPFPSGIDGNITARDLEMDSDITMNLKHIIELFEKTTKQNVSHKSLKIGGASFSDNLRILFHNMLSIFSVLILLMRLGVYIWSAQHTYTRLTNNPTWNMLPGIGDTFNIVHKGHTCLKSSPSNLDLNEAEDLIDKRIMLFLSLLNINKDIMNEHALKFTKILHTFIDIRKCMMSGNTAMKSNEMSNAVFKSFLNGDINFSDRIFKNTQNSSQEVDIDPMHNNRMSTAIRLVNNNTPTNNQNSEAIVVSESSSAIVKFKHDNKNDNNPTYLKLLNHFDDAGVKKLITADIVDNILRMSGNDDTFNEDGLLKIIRAEINRVMNVENSPKQVTRFSSMVGDLGILVGWSALTTYTSYDPLQDALYAIAQRYRNVKHALDREKMERIKAFRDTIAEAEDIYRNCTGFVTDSVNFLTFLVVISGVLLTNSIIHRLFKKNSLINLKLIAANQKLDAANQERDMAIQERDVLEVAAQMYVNQEQANLRATSNRDNNELSSERDDERRSSNETQMVTRSKTSKLLSNNVLSNMSKTERDDDKNNRSRGGYRRIRRTRKRNITKRLRKTKRRKCHSRRKT